jgi:hypothetical protein
MSVKDVKRACWWLEAHWQCSREERSTMPPLGPLPYTGHEDGSTSIEFDDVALFTLQTDAVTYDRGKLRI